MRFIPALFFVLSAPCVWAAAYVPWSPSFSLWYPVIDSSTNVAISSSAPIALPFPQPTPTSAQSPMFVAPPSTGGTQADLLLDAPYFSNSQPVAEQTIFVQVNGGKAFGLPGIQLSTLPAPIIVFKNSFDAIALSPEQKSLDDQTREGLNQALQAALKEFPAGQYRLKFFYR